MRRLRASTVLLGFVIILASCCTSRVIAVAANDISAGSSVNAIDNSYYTYYNNHKEENRPSGIISAVANAEMDDYNGQKCVLLKQAHQNAEWKVQIPENGCYSLMLDYMALEGSGRDIEFSIRIDGKTLFSESSDLSVPRIWKDSETVGNKKDSSGNDLRPAQIESVRWNNVWIGDTNGMYEDPYIFSMTKGEHIICVTLNREAMAIADISVGQPNKSPSYDEYLKLHSDANIFKQGTIRIEAENAYEKNNIQLYPVYDRGSAATLPNDPYAIKLNTIGQSNWSSQGQWISWKVAIKEKGMYRISFRARQDQNQGMISYRTLAINGAVPFKEAENIEFPYSQDWYIKTLGDPKALLVYLEPGDVISLECPAGRMSEVLRQVNQAVLDLNDIYRKIIIVTGTSPDAYRDYSLESHIPELSESLKKVRENLKLSADKIFSVTGKSNSQVATLHEMMAMLDDFIDMPSNIVGRFDSFKSNIESLGSLVLSFSSQPLELDCILFSDPGTDIPKANASFIKSLTFGFKKFVASFLNDYDSYATGNNGTEMNVWISTGRDQAQILSNLINSYYRPASDIRIKLNLVDTGNTLIQATLAGRGPDCALMVSSDTPVNLAMRGALVDLKRFDIDSVYDEYPVAAWTPFYYNGGLYAMPETLSFNMIFYRTDVFEQLGLSVPSTWEDFYNVMEILQASNLQVGIQEASGASAGVSASISVFDSFLFQSGGTYFNENLDKTVLDTPIAFEAFTRWVELYSKYGLARDFDFFNRFRTGEMPIGLSAYTTYNQLTAAAPELRGLWKMAPLPGTTNENGVINRSEPAAGTCCIMLNSAEKKHIASEAYRFLSWWTGAEIQTRYAKELESTLGVAARYNPANIKVLGELGWNAEELSAIKEQMQYLKNVNQIPGSYLIPRALTSAFRSSVDNGSEPFRELSIYNKDINSEIKRKRAEFHLD